jgi:hypothetical protein
MKRQSTIIFTQQYIPEDNSELHTRRCENLKSHKIKSYRQLKWLVHIITVRLQRVNYCMLSRDFCRTGTHVLFRGRVTTGTNFARIKTVVIIVWNCLMDSIFQKNTHEIHDLNSYIQLHIE